MEFPGIARPFSSRVNEWMCKLRETVPKLVRARTDILRGRNLIGKPVEYDSGRLLIFDYQSTMSDGLASSETSGLLDEHNCPPPVFWLDLVVSNELSLQTTSESVLLSWIPDTHLDLVSKGVYVTSEQCLTWADNLI